MARWLCGVISCQARKDTLLPATLASIRRAGFSPDRIFADGVRSPGEWETKFGCEITSRWPSIGAWGNTWLGIQELWIRSRTSFDYLLLAQDDARYALNVRQFIEETFKRKLVPDRVYLNLFEFVHQHQMRVGQCNGHDGVGWYRGIEIKPGQGPKGYQRGLGAVALVFTREGVETLLRATSTVSKPIDPELGYRKVDGQIVNAMNEMGWSEFVLNPSLTYHTGHVTSIHGLGRPQLRHPQTPSWRGENFDSLSLLSLIERAK